MNKNLSKKVFFITFSLLLGLMLVIFVFQTFFFESFYEIKKKNNLAKESINFATLYSNQIEDSFTIIRAMKIFENNTNAKIGIFSSHTQELLYIPEGDGKDSEEVKVMTQFHKDLLTSETLREEILIKGKTESIIFTDKYSDTKKIGVLTPMSLFSKNDSIIVSVASIQPIEEASLVIREFYSYILVGFIFISVILSLVYTNLISKPLVKINKVAGKMSKMDFTEKCIVDREDEIGSLASTLNFLSTNLNGALLDLKEKNKKLEEDIEKERRLEKMRKDFVDSVSHELKTPIGIIEGYAEGLKDNIVSGEYSKEYIETIIDESQKMSKLVSNMLELSRLESGTVMLNKESFNLNRLVNHIVTTLSLEAEEHKVNLTCTMDEDYAYVFADPFKIEQVVTNLITNAIKYTPEGNDIKIKISQEMENIIFKISNFGITLDDNEVPQLFSKFYRRDKSRDRSKNSTGLGLSIVKNILNLHKFTFTFGKISNGMEFKILFPLETKS